MFNKKIGVALSAGSARGLAHIGVLKVLNEHNIPIHCVAGTSMGSLVGGLHSAGISIDIIEALAVNLNQKKWMDVSVPKKGFIKGNKILKILKLLTKGCNIEDLPIPYGCVSTDLATGKRIIHTEGNLAEAIRASISIPGVFAPYKQDEMLLVDGAIVDRMPVSLCHSLGAEFIIAVDVSTQISEVEVNSIFDVIVQSMNIMQSELLKTNREECDLLIRPDVQSINPNHFSSAEKAIAAGEKAGRDIIPALERVIKGGSDNETKLTTQ
ncbi:patatin-like phospholipase family protein [Natranaerobius trueperi]|uniref:Esterase n=1 Tax=Natranaerobius trueperi TaxID=759412 RepID=A0A226BZG1_9FIRM|nr:patatin-like phospholipase family protein [Natranaerobius trueperi]OWZ84182.1 esterase [Natranaerobius trueperi]